MPTLVEKPPEGEGWIHEVKFDGYRSQIIIDDADVRIFTLRGLDWSAKYRPQTHLRRGNRTSVASRQGPWSQGRNERI